VIAVVLAGKKVGTCVGHVAVGATGFFTSQPKPQPFKAWQQDIASAYKRLMVITL